MRQAAGLYAGISLALFRLALLASGSEAWVSLCLGCAFMASAAVLWFNVNRRLVELLMNLSIPYIPVFLGLTLLGLAFIQRGSGSIIPGAALLLAAYLLLGLGIGNSLRRALRPTRS